MFVVAPSCEVKVVTPCCPEVKALAAVLFVSAEVGM